jgi:hypothetical protein
MKFRMRALSLVFLAAPVMLAGCATYDFSKPPPAQSQPISVSFSNEGPNGWTDLPIGTYRVPNSTVIIAGQLKNPGIGMMFGLVGVLAENSVGASEGKHAVSDVQAALQVDLTQQAGALTQQAMTSGRYGQAFSAAADANGPTLVVSPYTVITFVNDTEVRPYVILKATLKPSASGGNLWTTRYIASSGKPVQLAGENSLTANSGQLLKDAQALDLQRAVNAMLDDVATRRGRDQNTQMYVETSVPYVRQRFGLTGVQLSDDGGALVFLPHVADANVFAGVEILDESVTLHRPATADDKVKALDDK